MTDSTLFIGTAGWSIERECRALFPENGTHLERYASTLNAVEINSSFYRPHMPKTYARWAACTPPDFRFSVKLPREITHKRRFVDVAEPLDRFLSEATSLGSKLGPILIQLPPSFELDEPLARRFFTLLRGRHAGDIVFEPRHSSWFTPAAEALLEEFRIARVAADPAPVPEAGETGGWGGIRYVRLHGAPRIYYSEYTDDFLHSLAPQLADPPVETWCIFDNTALGFAAADALRLKRMLGR
jgi:uncharacterized protein YecE (DUF72 family)